MLAVFFCELIEIDFAVDTVNTVNMVDKAPVLTVSTYQLLRLNFAISSACSFLNCPTRVRSRSVR